MFKGLHHAAYRVRDLDKTLEFYCGKLGFREAFRLNHPETGALWIVYLQVAAEQFLEVFPVEAGEAIEGGSRYLHLCLRTEDLKATVAELQRRDVALSREVRRGQDGNLQAWIKDPDGNDIELMQMERESPQARASVMWRGV